MAVHPEAVRDPVVVGTWSDRWWVVIFGEAMEVRASCPGANWNLTPILVRDDGESRKVLALMSRPGAVTLETATDASCAVVFEGRLNRVEDLRQALEGVKPHGGNAELILQGYLQRGEAVFEYIQGTFVLILWDGRRDTFWWVRDPLGVYPLFYSETGRLLLISPSVEALVQHPRVSGEVNRPALADHLCHRWPDPEETFYAHVHRVPAGHAIRLSRGGKRLYRYWDPAPLDEVLWVSEDALDRFEMLLERAVDRCMTEPAGVFLSGGVDSATVAAMATDLSHKRNRPVPWALSLVFPHPDCNEEPIQRHVASALGMPQVVLYWDEAVGPVGILRAALEMSQSLPLPLLNFWLPAYGRLALEARQRGCRVILTGGGGDEWLSVTPMLAADLIQTLNVRGLVRLWQSEKNSYPISSYRALKNVVWRYGLLPLVRRTVVGVLERQAPDLLTRYRRWRISRWTPPWVAPDPTLRREIIDRTVAHIPRNLVRSFYLYEMRTALEHPLNSMEMEEIFEVGQRMNLLICQPFWDVEMVDLLFRTHPDLLIRGGRNKGLVWQFLARRFPQVGLQHRKKVLARGFYTSILLREGPLAWKIYRGVPTLERLGIVDSRGLQSFIENGWMVRRFIYRIWDLLNLEAWVRTRA